MYMSYQPSRPSGSKAPGRGSASSGCHCFSAILPCIWNGCHHDWVSGTWRHTSNTA